MSVIRKLFQEIVDYAGLFPPAALPLHEVVANYARYIDSDDAWMLARLILPATRLSEMADQRPFLESEKQWRVSALVPGVDSADNAFVGALQAIDEFNRRFADQGVVDTVEIRTPTMKLVSETIKQIPPGLNAFLEIPHQQDPSEMVAAVAAAPENIFAKIRTGGVTADLIPSAAEVARFVACCAQADAGFKATAGLHHPLRGEYRLTYDQNPQRAIMFGFVNVFVAACFAFAGRTDDTLLESILLATETGSFEFAENEISFQSQSIPTDAIEAIRSSRAVSFGSCSFTEPKAELLELGWFKATA